MIYKILKKTFLFTLLFLFACQSKSSKHFEEISKSKISQSGDSKNKNNRVEDNSNKETFTVVSWNIQDLGRSKSLKEINSIAKIIKSYDLILIQEVVGKDPAGIQAVAKIVDELNRMGSKWYYRVSNPTNSPSSNMSERYGFLWKTSRVSLKGKAYLDSDLRDLCYREPFIGNFIFKGTNTIMSVINYHSRKHDDNPEDEIKYLSDYEERLKTKNIIIAGDFNVDERHVVWDKFYQKGYKNALSKTPTTLKMKCKFGKYLNHSIDNFYYKSNFKILKSGSIDFVNTCESLESARKLSDHLPVYLVLSAVSF
ncbi:endonuclease/exonuclease/phosphatase family protein [uncultured Polaribacter sp.]|uniref:endonuclease/exonuclease/phosphatase family protein n=1 Tax=uncultured Polaribacter sp. TaxID=174711 RepID=UPI0026391720|nr:endonuclease/exonuclease/phosphatase family protein [uncultured Polaribacter sp.]